MNLKMVLYLENLCLTEKPRIFNPKPRVVPERQAVKKPHFSIIPLKINDTTIQIKPYEKALFLGCKFHWIKNIRCIKLKIAPFY